MRGSNSSCGTIGRNPGSFSGGAGPNRPSSPWQPRQFSLKSTSKCISLSDRTGRSSSLGFPGQSPAQPAAKRDKETRRQGDKETRKVPLRCPGGVAAVTACPPLVSFSPFLPVSLSPCHPPSPPGPPAPLPAPPPPPHPPPP